MSGVLSIFPINGNQKTTQESTNKKEIVSEINDTEEFPEVIFPINFKIINQHQRKYSSLKASYKMGTYQKVYFLGGSNININLITCEDKTFIPSIL